MFYKTNYILHHINKCLQKRRPFSIIRLGDGDIKLLKLLLKNKYHKGKFKQQGIPESKEAYEKVLSIYKESANKANFISNFDIYFGGKNFWKRNIKPQSLHKIQDWKQVYSKVGITNDNYCSPEIGFFFFLNTRRNLFSLLKDRKICLITSFPHVRKKLKMQGFKVVHFLIPGRYENHFLYYDENINKLNNIVSEFDVFLVGGGTFGRGYSNFIKEKGKIALDIGQVFDIWEGLKLPPRLDGLIKYNRDSMMFELTNEGKKFKKGI